MSDHKYKLRYSIEPGSYTKEDLYGADNFGGCDQILFCSYVEGDDGSGSYAWFSSKGEGPGVEMDWGRTLNCWLMLTKKLGDEAPADCPNQKEILQAIFENFRQAIIAVDSSTA